ncbi:hypothetical protein [Mycobacterium sp. Root265]|uniref:hypothetical protein n=1 Tax=Mycobacterium sp. Root265 TaxID=1736504 RepID=UPI000B319BB6|nr:hypothetical protein [Mycobacterium sp. Root265]
MASADHPTNPLFSAPSSNTPVWAVAPSRTAAQRAVKFGGYGGMAVAAWLVAAVATGYGVAAADTTGGASESSSTSSSADSGSTTSSAASSDKDSSANDDAASGSGATSATGQADTIGAGDRDEADDTESDLPVDSTSPGDEAGDGTDDAGTETDSSEPAGDEESSEVPVYSPPVLTVPDAGQPTKAPGRNGSHSDSDDTLTAPAGPPETESAPQATEAGIDDAVVSTTPSAVKAVATIAETSVNAAKTSRSGASIAMTADPAAPVTEAATMHGVLAAVLAPFVAPSPAAPSTPSPALWTLLAWVRRSFFNQAPTIAYNPTTTVQTGQTLSGNLGATDAEGDALTYKVTKGPQYGTLTIDQATGNFTYTPDDINYDAAQIDSFTVSVTDGKFNLLSLFRPHGDRDTIGVNVLNPTVERAILNMPDGVTKPVNPRYSEDGKSVYFSGTPAAGGRGEIYQINIDGTDAKCLTCGLVAPTVAGSDPAVPINILKPVPFYDGTGRVVVLLNNPDPRYAIFEPAGYNGIGSPARIVNVITPDGGGATLPGLPPGGILNREREMRPSPDGTHVLFTRIVFGQTGNFQALPIVGALTANGDHYEVTNARVVWPTGESKQWTPDGKGVIIQGGAIDAGNIDDIMVDLSGQTGDILYPGSPFRGTRVTGNLDYDEDIDMSPNKQWITVGSLRGFDALTAMTRFVRQNFLPVYLAAIYDQYADGQVRNVSNQNWAVAIEDDLKGANGIPLFVQDDPNTPDVDEGDGWISRSMPSWNADGTAVTFWESGNGDEHGIAPTESRLVIANLKYTTSVGSVGDTTTVFNTSAFPDLTTYVAKTTPLPPTGSYNGVGGGTAAVSEVIDPTTHQTTRTVQYTNYKNEDGLILNGTESAIYGPSQLSVTYLADVDVTDATGASRGTLDANAVVTLLPTQAVTGYITSTLDGDTQTIPDPAKVEDAKTGA